MKAHHKYALGPLLALVTSGLMWAGIIYLVKKGLR